MELEGKVALDTWGEGELPEFWVGGGTILPEMEGCEGRRTGPSGEVLETGGECEGRECVVAGGCVAAGRCGELVVEPRTSGEVLFPSCLCRPAM